MSSAYALGDCMRVAPSPPRYETSSAYLRHLIHVRHGLAKPLDDRGRQLS